MAQLMRNASPQRLEIPEHPSREVNAPRLQAGKGEFGLVGMKGLADCQEFLVFENDNGQPFVGVRGVAKIVGCYLNDAGEKPFLRLGSAYDGGVSSPHGTRQDTDKQTLHTNPN